MKLGKQQERVLQALKRRPQMWITSSDLSLELYGLVYNRSARLMSSANKLVKRNLIERRKGPSGLIEYRYIEENT